MRYGMHMMLHSPADHSSYHLPATYQICVLGSISPRWCSRLEGMAISVGALGRVPPMTILLGELCDQDALTAVLNKLYDLQLTILSVERIAPGA
jgi:hypothetical protein